MDQGVHFATILASLAELDYWIEWRLLNSADFGLPQNRQRVFIVGVRRNGDKGGDASDTAAVRLASTEDLVTRAAGVGVLHSLETWPEIASHGKKFSNWGLAASGRFCGANLHAFSNSRSCGTLNSILQDKAPLEFDFTESTVERLKASKHVKRFVHGVEILSNQGGGARMGYTVFGVSGLAQRSLRRPAAITSAIRSVGDIAGSPTLNTRDCKVFQTITARPYRSTINMRCMATPSRLRWPLG